MRKEEEEEETKRIEIWSILNDIVSHSTTIAYITTNKITPTQPFTNYIRNLFLTSVKAVYDAIYFFVRQKDAMNLYVLSKNRFELTVMNSFRVVESPLTRLMCMCWTREKYWESDRNGRRRTINGFLFYI